MEDFGHSGLEVLVWIRARFGRELPVLFVTNRVGEDQLVAALEAGADDYMVKRVRHRELIARARSACTGSPSRDRVFMDTILLRVAQILERRFSLVTLCPRERAKNLTPGRSDKASGIMEMA
ncbi:response regulator [Burkholderia sp. Z1]|uniref:response regulator transcription factor n=1 Tax=Burkholderia sp. Z1 TaxID=2759039 RepID=UPI0018666B1C